MFRTCVNSYTPYSRREYRSVEKNVSHHPLHAVGMQSISTDAFHTECRWFIGIFYLPSDTFLRNVLRQMEMLILSYTNRYNINTSCCILFVNELKRSAKH